MEFSLDDGQGIVSSITPCSCQALSYHCFRRELQLDRCNSAQAPDFCRDSSVADNARRAYNKLWDTIQANSNLLSSEVWSWLYRDNRFEETPLGGIPPPPGIGGATGQSFTTSFSSYSSTNSFSFSQNDFFFAAISPLLYLVLYPSQPVVVGKLANGLTLPYRIQYPPALVPDLLGRQEERGFQMIGAILENRVRE